MSPSVTLISLVMALAVTMISAAPVLNPAQAKRCKCIGQAQEAVRLAQVGACDLADDYAIYYERYQIAFTYPGPNSVPCQVLDPTSEEAAKNAWKVNLGYKAGVLAILQGYLNNTIRLEKGIDNLASNSFLQRIPNITNTSAKVLQQLKNMTSTCSLPDLSVEELNTEKDRCDPPIQDSPMPGVNWPPSPDQYENNVEEFKMWASMYIMGTLEANCLTLRMIYDSIYEGLNSVCPKAV